MNLYEQIKNAGVVGAGGAGFPTHLKYKGGVEYVIANGAECEPLLSVDKAIMLEFSDELLDGLEKAVHFLNAKKGILALKEKHGELVEALKKKISSRENLELLLLDDFYPAGDEFVLVYEAMGRLVPEGGIPLNVGAVVNNVCTLVNISRASMNVPVTSRPLTVAGEVKNPSNFILPIGVSIKEVISLAGGPKTFPFKVILGGPMMGEIVEDLNLPVTKTTSAIIVLAENHYLVQRKLKNLKSELKIAQSVCDQCRYCTDLCPRFLLGHNLEPHLVMRSLSAVLPELGSNVLENKLMAVSYLCSGCQACSIYACPLFLSPGKILQNLRQELIKNKIKNPHNRASLESRPFRDFRKIPLKRLISRLDLKKYICEIPFKKIDYNPDEVKIPLKQHIGAPASPVVKAGDPVKKGELIAVIPEGSEGAGVHASISGTVANISSNQITISSI